MVAGIAICQVGGSESVGGTEVEPEVADLTLSLCTPGANRNPDLSRHQAQHTDDREADQMIEDHRELPSWDRGSIGCVQW